MLVARSHRNAFAALVIAATALTACSDNPAGVDTDDLDPAIASQVQTQIQTALQEPVLFSLFGDGQSGIALAPAGSPLATSAALAATDVADPLAGLRSNGALYRQVLRAAIASSGPMLALAEPGDAAEWYIEPEAWGRTYVKDPATGERYWDETRTDAPARGVRIVLYQRTAGEEFNSTVVGALDVIDSSSTTERVGRINVYNGASQLVGTFRETSMTTESTMSATFGGTFGIAPRTFVVADTMSGSFTVSGTDTTTNLRWRSVSKADFADAEVSFLVEGMNMGDETSLPTAAEFQIVLGEHTTRIVGTGAMGGEGGTADIFIDGDLVARVVNDDSDPLRGPNGGAVDPKVRQYLTAALIAAAHVPNALVVRIIIAFAAMV